MFLEEDAVVEVAAARCGGRAVASIHIKIVLSVFCGSMLLLYFSSENVKVMSQLQHS